MNKQPINRDYIVRLFGDIEDHKIIEIQATQASHEDLEEVAMWLAKQSAVMGELHKPLSGVTAQVYEILTGDDEFPERRNGP
jgi:hypothetical protein